MHPNAQVCRVALWNRGYQVGYSCQRKRGCKAAHIRGDLTAHSKGEQRVVHRTLFETAPGNQDVLACQGRRAV